MTTQTTDDISLSRPIAHNLNGAAGSFRVTQTNNLTVDDAGDLNVDFGGPRVERIFKQFLQHRRGALDDLAGGDAGEHVFGQLSDQGHSGFALSAD